MEIQIELQRMLDTIVLNAGYHRYIESIQVLMEAEFYIEICQLIFPEININLVKILEDRNTTPGEKLQELIDQLSKLLKFDKIRSISGEGIVNGDPRHIYWLLEVLVDCSERCIEKVNSSVSSKGKRNKTDPDKTLRSQDERRNIYSALGMNKKDKRTYHHGEEDEVQEQGAEQHQKDPYQLVQQVIPQYGDYRQYPEQHPDKGVLLQPALQRDRSSDSTRPIPVQKPTRVRFSQLRPQSAHRYSATKKRLRSQKASRKNFYQSVVDIFINEKNRTLKATSREQRKNKNKDLQEAKYKYSTYLKSYAKENRVKRNRLSKRKPSKEHKNQLPLQDFQNIQSFFRSFSYQFRDQKTAYLRKIQKLIRQQEVDRMCYKNRVERQIKGSMEVALEKQIESVKHQHNLRVKMIKEEGRQTETQIEIMKKAYEEHLRRQKKDLKQQKKKELKMIESFIKQENQKVLMAMEQGGRLEQIVMELYKRY